MTRIIGGTLAGRRLAVPPSGARPTTDRVREAVFSSLGHRIADWGSCRALDLFAGSGALGLEAISRGAARATLVEMDRAALTVLRSNAVSLSVSDRATIVAADALLWRPALDSSYDLAFVDPPYSLPSDRIAHMLARLWDAGGLDPDALVVVERPTRDGASPLPERWGAADRRRYGETTVWYGRAQAPVAHVEGT